MTQTDWTTVPPTEPGEYETRECEGGRINRVIVTRKGRGLSVYCPAYGERSGMSEVRTDGLEWRKVGP